MLGFFNRILEIDLTTEDYCYQGLADEVLQNTLGGKGLGTWLLLRHNPMGVDPLSPENRLIITTGPVTGTKFWGGSRFGVYTKSPATGGYAESYCGGSLASRIKGCGIDAVIIRGRCPKPRFITITETGVDFHDASRIAGADCFTSEEAILNHAGPNARAMVIGPAGEARVAFACIKSDTWRSLGRCGMGAVMGSKQLKGISFDGRLTCEIADGDQIRHLIKTIANKEKNSPTTRLYRTEGTPLQVKVANTKKFFPTRYWQSGFFEDWETLSSDYMQQQFDVKSKACPNCFLKCTKYSKIRHGRHAGLELEGPEYETIYALGGLNAIKGLEEVAWLNVICDTLGMDTMSAGNISAFAIEAYRKGETDFAIDYNQPDRMAELFEMIVYRKGIGDVLANGIKEASITLNMENDAIHVKGLEPAGFDPRVLKGMGLSYATAARGACHLRGTFYKSEIIGETADDALEHKVIRMIDYEDRATLFDSLILCRFFRDFILWETLEPIIEALTGLKSRGNDLLKIANRITLMTRAYNKREGLDEEHDTLPLRFLKEPTEEGASLSATDMAFMTNIYNTIRSERSEEDYFFNAL